MITKTNPLLIEVIIEKVLECLQEKDLKSCRLVCTLWFDYGTKSLQKVVKPIVFGDLYKVNLIRLRPDLDTIRQFISTLSYSEDNELSLPLPYTKFDLKSNIFAKSNLHLLEKFFDNFGHSIKLMNINLAYESADNFSKDCFPNLFLPSLKTLDFCNILRGEMIPSLMSELLTTSRDILLQRILDASPNLETMSFWCDNENLAWPGEVIQVLTKVNLPKLRNLKMSFPLTNYQLISLSRLNFRLTSLTFFIREPLFNTKSFYEILFSQRETLQSLKLVDLQCDSLKFIEFPEMKELTSLEIEGAFYGDYCQFSFDNFSLKKIPKINRILLRNCHRLNFNINSFLALPSYYNIQQQVCFSLTELHVTLSHDFVNAEWIKEISILFPQLKNIHIMFSAQAKELLTTVFQHLTTLESLTLNVRKCGENLDSILTGVSPNVILEKRILQQCLSLNTIENIEIEINNSLKSKPGLMDLKNLRVLEFKGEHRNYKDGISAISEVSAYLGFLQMRNLRNIVLRHTGMNLSEKCTQDLAERFHLIQYHPEE